MLKLLLFLITLIASTFAGILMGMAFLDSSGTAAILSLLCLCVALLIGNCVDWTD